TLGATRMRVRGVYHNPGEPVPTDPCYPYAFGETEDYSVVIETTTGLSDPAAFTVGIRPNPAAGRVMIDLPSSEAATIELLDLQGRVMLALRTNTDRVALDLANVAAGSYLVRITTITHLVIERLEVVRSGN
ncbi:MAG: T9SS type A sorting domain-containing protein, partial [Flavobacteriales bacterium]|nr:T9SS type A sorting domain-containing protein [Flavobacteriales bacterium]